MFSRTLEECGIRPRGQGRKDVRGKSAAVRDARLDWVEIQDYLALRAQPGTPQAARSACEALAELADTPEMDKRLEAAFSDLNSRYLEPVLGQQISRRQRELLQHARGESLEVTVELDFQAISIPDTNRDEVRFEAVLTVGTDALRLARFLKEREQLGERDPIAVVQGWRKADSNIANNPMEEDGISACLGLELDHSTSQNIVGRIVYSYGARTGKVWRSWRVAETLSMVHNWRDYPFEISALRVELWNAGGYDASELLYSTSERDVPSVLCSELVPPRGCLVSFPRTQLESVAKCPDPGSYLVPVLRLHLQVVRRPEAALWRVFLPGAMILGVGYAGTSAALLSGGPSDVETAKLVALQILPAVLIGCVALHLAAARDTPAHSGRTSMDSVFIAGYIQLVVLYCALLTLMLFRVDIARIWAAWGAIGCGFYGSSVFGRILILAWRRGRQVRATGQVGA